MNDKNIIEFPVDRVKKPQKNAPSKLATSLQQSNKLVPITTLAVFLLFAFVNSMIGVDHPTEEGSRSIASSTMSRNVSWEHKIARKVAYKKDQRGLASIARTPNARDALVGSLLHRKYSVNFENGKIVNIEFPQKVVDQDVPEYIDRFEFLNSHKSLLSVGYEKFRQISKKEVGANKIEIFELYKKPEHTLAQVEFKLDKYGRLISMKVLPKARN